MDYQDKTLVCQDCKQEFVWTASEQAFFADKGFSAPVRCQDCRRKRKAEKQGGGNGRFDRSNGPRGEREMFTIVCAECGNEGQVPFKPRNPESVLCADCFRKQKDAERGITTPAPVAASTSDDAADDTAVVSDDASSTADATSEETEA